MTKEEKIKNLKVNKWLLVETTEPYYQTVSESGVFIQDPNSSESELIEGKYKLLCSGDQFEKDQKTTKENGCVLGQILTCVGFDAFVQEIEKAGFYWGNPLGNEPQMTEDKYKPEREFLEENPEELVFGEHYADWTLWQEAESRTFNPSKTRIYEIMG